MKKIISIFLLLSHTSLLFADTLTFKSGLKIEGKLVSISEEHELDPKTGTTSEVTFNVYKFSINMIPNEMIVGKVNESIYLFDQQSVDVIIDDQGKILFPKDDKGPSTDMQFLMLLGGLGGLFLLFMAVKAFLGVFSIGIG
ncbi:hypothetical protein OAP50_01390 [bacterium]|jgi:hypothetical protein|nr:hypothetical protein [bacterium]